MKLVWYAKRVGVGKKGAKQGDIDEYKFTADLSSK